MVPESLAKSRGGGIGTAVTVVSMTCGFVLDSKGGFLNLLIFLSASSRKRYYIKNSKYLTPSKNCLGRMQAERISGAAEEVDTFELLYQFGFARFSQFVIYISQTM